MNLICSKIGQLSRRLRVKALREIHCLWTWSCSAIDISNIFGNTTFFAFAVTLDTELAESLRLKGCPKCSGTLNYGCYSRKSRSPFKAPLPENWDRFFSLCCSAEGCRVRVRPPSVRYAGRSPQNAGILLLAQLLKAGASQRSVRAICEELLISERTARRWLRFWKTVCRRSRWWAKLSGLLSLSGLSIIQLFHIYQADNRTRTASEKITSETASLWAEMTISVGDSGYAKDA